MSDIDYAPIIWADLLTAFGNEYGVAGLMGNLYGESGLIPFRVQGDFSAGYQASKDYTAKVDSGAITEEQFVNNGPGGGGYGLAQWTFHTRKRAYYRLVKNRGGSIGSEENGIAMLLQELDGPFASVGNTIRYASSIKEACDKVLYVYEAPANPDALEPSRLRWSEQFYARFSGKPIPGRFDLIIYQASQRKRKKRRLYV